MHSILLTTTGAGTTESLIATFVPLIFIFVLMYFMMIRPQQKEEKKKALMLNELAVGDTVLTTSGFYGTIIDITDDTVIVEFGITETAVFQCRKQQLLWLKNQKTLSNLK